MKTDKPNFWPNPMEEPQSPENGDLWFDAPLNSLLSFENGEWVRVDIDDYRDIKFFIETWMDGIPIEFEDGTVIPCPGWLERPKEG